VEMSGILVDTSAYSALHENHAEVVRVISAATRIHLNAVVLGEILAGFRKGTRYDANKTILDTFLEREKVEILPVDEETAVRYAVIRDTLRRNGTPITINDIWVAASAMQHALHVVTLDRDYLKVPQILVDCFDPA
jgi:tRNA(fMet)-specific endonuclease VapC